MLPAPKLTWHAAAASCFTGKGICFAHQNVFLLACITLLNGTRPEALLGTREGWHMVPASLKVCQMVNTGEKMTV